MRIRSLATCMAVSALGCAAAIPGSAPADPATSFDLPVSGVVENSCTGESVLIEGRMHMKFAGSVTATGIKTSVEMNLAGVKGTALGSNARYVEASQTSDMSHADFLPTGKVQANLESKDLLNRLGESGSIVMGDDLYVRVLAHLTVNANGVPTVERYEVSGDCR